jgi:hypothetical protein
MATYDDACPVFLDAQQLTDCIDGTYLVPAHGPRGIAAQGVDVFLYARLSIVQDKFFLPFFVFSFFVFRFSFFVFRFSFFVFRFSFFVFRFSFLFFSP